MKHNKDLHPMLRLLLHAVYAKAREIRRKERLTYKQIWKIFEEQLHKAGE
jgi:hypothetical protein